MLGKTIKIKSTDNTDILIFANKIQYVLEKKNGCLIGLDSGNCVQSGAKIKDVEKAIDKLLKG